VSARLKENRNQAEGKRQAKKPTTTGVSPTNSATRSNLMPLGMEAGQPEIELKKLLLDGGKDWGKISLAHYRDGLDESSRSTSVDALVLVELLVRSILVEPPIENSTEGDGGRVSLSVHDLGSECHVGRASMQPAKAIKKFL
jgi:hypothetical protein